MTLDPILVKTTNDYDILAHAQKLKQDASIVLPLLNVVAHPYTEFIINKILYHKFDSIENILKELKNVNNNIIPELISNAVQSNSVDYQRIEDTIGDINKIKYLNEFITFKKDILDEKHYL